MRILENSSLKKGLFIIFIGGLFVFSPFFIAAQSLVSQDIESIILPIKEYTGVKQTINPFPLIYFTEVYTKYQEREESLPYWAPSEKEKELLTRKETVKPILLNNDILAFYGHPLSKRMGILGLHSIEELDQRLSALADEYKNHNSGRGVKKAFYIIYGTVWPEGKIGILQDSVLRKYIDYALANDILVFIDHQIGCYGVADSLRTMLPYLRFPNVHLALDPEWRTEKPMEEIGSITAAELNEAQQIMEDYIIANNIGGERMLVVHQFNYIMIRNREQVRSDFERVQLIHCADGFGSPVMKRQSYAFNARADNIPLKGFKLFYNLGIPGAGYDEPLLSPKEVMELEPRPYVIMYQ